jgi:hypothetical protein
MCCASRPNDQNRPCANFLPAVVELAPRTQGGAAGALFYWNQNDRPRSFLNRSIAAAGGMCDAASAAVRHPLRASRRYLTDRMPVRSIKNLPQPRSIVPFGSCVDECKAIDLLEVRGSQPGVWQDQWDRYERISMIFALSVDRPPQPDGYSSGWNAAVLDKSRGLVLDSAFRQGKKDCCHVV